MKISSPEIFPENGEIVYRVRVQTSVGTGTLWYRIPDQFGDFITDSCDAPLVALLIPAMTRGEDIHVAGKLSERLLYTLSRPYQRLLQHVIPSLRQVKIHPAEIQSGTHERSAVATGFSGGIDSFCVLADHYYSEVPAGFKVTHLLFNNVGSHGTGERGERLFRARYARTAPVAAQIGLPLVRVDSNVDAYYGKKPLNFQGTHTPRNASVALLLQGGIGRYMYASAFSYPDAFVGATDSMGHSDTIALPLLATERLDVLSVGSEYTRVEKTLRVAAIAHSYSTLDICANPDRNPDRAGNCSTCWKCMRTLLTLDIAGLLERYSASFDLDAYAHQRSKYISEVLLSNEPLMREIVSFAKQRDFALPLSSRLHARITSMAGPPVRAARKLKNALQGKN
jgi:hypothetical protein